MTYTYAVLDVPRAIYAAVRALLDRADYQHAFHANDDGEVIFTLNGELTQMDLDKAREIVGLLNGAIEAAISDELMYRFLTEKIGLEPDRAGAALIDFREMRQGSRDVVNPN